MISIRPSKQPLFFKCPSSAIPPKTPIAEETEDARVGRAVHAAMAKIVRGEMFDLEVLAVEHGAPVERCGWLVANGCKIWAAISDAVPEPQAEVRLVGSLWSGTADVLSLTGRCPVLVDWKTGTQRHQYREQLMAYGVLTMLPHAEPRAKELKIVTAWLADREWDTVTISVEELMAHERRYRAMQDEIGTRYSPGEHCEFCPRRLECDARDGHLIGAAAGLVPVLKTNEIGREAIARAYPMAQHLRKALALYDDALRLSLASGPLPLEDGRSLQLQDEQRDKIDAALALPVLREHGFSDQQLASCLTLGKTKMLDIVSDTAGRGAKGLAKTNLLAKLDEAGAISQTISKKVVCK